MKNLTVKKIAIGLFLAGYAASGAYAGLNPTTTAESILGNAPSIYSSDKDDAVEHTVSLKITGDSAANSVAKGKDKKAVVGDYVHISYVLKDLDGDTDPDNVVGKTVSVWVQRSKPKAGESWSTVDWEKVDDVVITTDNTGENGHFYFRITQSMAGAERVGIQLQEKTKFGNPNANQWLNIADIWSNKNPGTDDKKPDNPGGGDEGPGKTDPDNPIGPIESDATSIGIFKMDSEGKVDWTVNLAAPKTTDELAKKTPKYGDKLTVTVWEKKDEHSTATSPDWSAGDLDKTDSHVYTWTLEGTAVTNEDGSSSNDPATATDVVTVGLDGNDATHKTIFLGSNDAKVKHNSVYSEMHKDQGGFKAGIQGFKLKVSADVEQSKNNNNNNNNNDNN